MNSDPWQMVGIGISITSLLISIFIACYIRHLDKQQRKRDESFYITAAIRDIQQLKEHMISIQAISEQDDDYDDDEQVETTQELTKYAERNNDAINKLILDTEFSMSRWMSLEPAERASIKKFVKTASWIMQEYLPRSSESEGTKKRRWFMQLEDLQERRSDTSAKIDELLLKYG